MHFQNNIENKTSTKINIDELKEPKIHNITTTATKKKQKILSIATRKKCLIKAVSIEENPKKEHIKCYLREIVLCTYNT